MAVALAFAMPNFSKFWEDNQLIEMGGTRRTHSLFVTRISEDPIMNPLGTPSGKIEIFSKTIEGYQLEDCPPHQRGWHQPVHRQCKDGELQLMTAHAAHRLHSQFNYAKIRERYAIANREPIWIHP